MAAAAKHTMSATNHCRSRFAWHCSAQHNIVRCTSAINCQMGGTVTILVRPLPRCVFIPLPVRLVAASQEKIKYRAKDRPIPVKNGMTVPSLSRDTRQRYDAVIYQNGT